jgi:hypothetical protein
VTVPYIFILEFCEVIDPFSVNIVVKQAASTRVNCLIIFTSVLAPRIQIQTQLFTSMQIRIQGTKTMRIRILILLDLSNKKYNFYMRNIL